MTKKLKTWQLAFLALLIIGTVMIVSRQRNTAYQHANGFIFGTVYNITYQYDSDLHSLIRDELQKVDASLSPFNKTSVISAVNRNEDVVTDDMFAEVFDRAMTISRETDGAFDITVAPLVNLWGFGFRNDVPPTDRAVDSLRCLTGFDKVRMADRRVVKSDPRIMLDCSAIAKGYGCDVVARLLRRRGVENFMVEIGGEVVVSGVSSKRVPWRIGVNKPTEDSLSTANELQATLSITDRAMATSGNYRNYYYKDGRRYAHTIDPRSGRPVQHSLLSATVLAADCATADAYATAFMVMGMERARKVLERHKELMAYFIYSDDRGDFAVWASPSLEPRINK